MRRLALATLAFASSLAVASPADDARKPVVFMAEARVEVDPDGKLVKVEAAQDLPEAIRTYIEQQLKTWQFAPRPRAGEAGNAATWVSLGACAVPTPQGGYTMGLEFHGNGPRIAGGGRWTLTGGLFKGVHRSQFEGELTVHFVVRPDGTAEVESVDGVKTPVVRRYLQPEIEQWMKGLRFDPEAIGGRPVATRATVPIRFLLGGGRNWRPPDDLEKKFMESPACTMAAAAGQALSPGMRAVAVDSVMGIVPSI